MIIPTLAAGPLLGLCLDSLKRQRCEDFETVVVDNGGTLEGEARPGVRVITPAGNLGFGGAINAAIESTESELVAVLNDDAEAEPDWLEALVRAADAHPRDGMFASCVLLGDTGLLDSAGMLLCGDGTGKQRGHRRPPEEFERDDEVFFPSGSAALFRRAMLDQIGLFESGFFLYGEDTDLGLRGRWAGWGCRYVAGARVHHRYSRSAGAASLLKAYYVERNRLFVAIRNLPPKMLLRVPATAIARYWHHARASRKGIGAAGAHRAGGGSAIGLGWVVVKAHAAILVALPRLLAQRRAIRRGRVLTDEEFGELARRYRIEPEEVAAQ